MSKIPDNIEDYSITLWLVKNQLKTEDGKDYDLKDHLYWFDILEDWSPKQVWYKAAQVGGTLAATLKMIYAIRRYGINAIYTMPSASDVATLVKSKVNRMVAQNECLQGWIKGDSIYEKQIGDNMAYFRGTFTEQAAISIPSDLNIHDEIDRSKQDILEIYSSRLDNSEYAWQWHFSNPSTLGNGVARHWVKSDQKEWFITCEGCQKEQYLKWPESICQKRRVYQCRHCQKELTDDERRRGRWVKKVLDAEWSGYHISQMMNIRKTANDILKAYEEKPADYFSNFVLGLPYVGEGNKLTWDAFEQNFTEPDTKQEQVVIGCDSGKKKHWVAGNLSGLFDYGVTEDWTDIARLLEKYSKSILVVDGMPDITGPRWLYEKYPGRVYINFYAQDRKSMELVRFGKGNEEGQVRTDRNRLIQQVVDEFTMGRIPVQGDERKWRDYYTHWENIYRVIETNALGVQVIKWESANGNDHWVHASSYWRAGMVKMMHGSFELPKVVPEGIKPGLDVSPQGTVVFGGLKNIKQDNYDWRKE